MWGFSKPALFQSPKDLGSAGYLRREPTKTTLSTTHSRAYRSLAQGRLLKASNVDASFASNGAGSPLDVEASMRVVHAYATKVKKMTPSPEPSPFGAFPPFQPLQGDSFIDRGRGMPFRHQVKHMAPSPEPTPFVAFPPRISVQDSCRSKHLRHRQSIFMAVSCDRSPEEVVPGEASVTSVLRRRSIPRTQNTFDLRSLVSPTDSPPANMSSLAPSGRSKVAEELIATRLAQADPRPRSSEDDPRAPTRSSTLADLYAPLHLSSWVGRRQSDSVLHHDLRASGSASLRFRVRGEA